MDYYYKDSLIAILSKLNKSDTGILNSIINELENPNILETSKLEHELLAKYIMRSPSYLYDELLSRFDLYKKGLINKSEYSRCRPNPNFNIIFDATFYLTDKGRKIVEDLKYLRTHQKIPVFRPPNDFYIEMFDTTQQKKDSIICKMLGIDKLIDGQVFINCKNP